jgi:double-stranded uracil-DNA glycosylase
VFCGINPGLYSGAVGHHFARPGNRFWKALHGAGFTDRELSPFEDGALPGYGLGVTNLVARATASADMLTANELRAGARRLERKVRRYRPRAVAVVGVTAYRTGFRRPRTAIGPQEETLGGAVLWVLPNPSGRTAAYQLPALIEAFRRLREAID